MIPWWAAAAGMAICYLVGQADGELRRRLRESESPDGERVR